MRFLLPAVFTLSFGAVVPAQQPARQDSTPNAVIQGAGCVDSGVEGGCKVLKDTKTGDTYVLFFGGKEPAPGTAIWFKGAGHQGMTTCMQGKAVDVSKWKRTKAQCPAGTLVIELLSREARFVVQQCSEVAKKQPAPHPFAKAAKGRGTRRILTELFTHP